jgi:hypothetical protein
MVRHHRSYLTQTKGTVQPPNKANNTIGTDATVVVNPPTYNPNK